MGERANFSFTERDESDGSVRVRVVGELDVAGAPGVQAVLRRLEGQGSDVLLDLTGTSFRASLLRRLVPIGSARVTFASRFARPYLRTMDDEARRALPQAAGD